MTGDNMETIRINTQSLRAASENLEQAIGTAEQSVGTIESTGQSMDAMWEGEAEQKFMAVLREDLEYIRKVILSVRQLAGYESNAAGSYDACEGEVSGEISSLTIG